MYRTHCTRDKVYKYNPHISGNCFQCGTSDSLIHTFGDCSKIQKIWVNIDDWLSDLFKVRFNFNPSVCILQDMSKDTVRYPLSWIILFSSVVLKNLILKHWKSTHPPTLLHWKREMSHYLNVEKAITMERNKSSQCEIIWAEVLQALST